MSKGTQSKYFLTVSPWHIDSIRIPITKKQFDKTLNDIKRQIKETKNDEKPLDDIKEYDFSDDCISHLSYSFSDGDVNISLDKRTPKQGYHWK